MTAASSTFADALSRSSLSPEVSSLAVIPAFSGHCFFSQDGSASQDFDWSANPWALPSSLGASRRKQYLSSIVHLHNLSLACLQHLELRHSDAQIRKVMRGELVAVVHEIGQHITRWSSWSALNWWTPGHWQLLFEDWRKLRGMASALTRFRPFVEPDLGSKLDDLFAMVSPNGL